MRFRRTLAPCPVRSRGPSRLRRSGVAVAVVVALCFSAACNSSATPNVFRLGGTEPIDSMNPFVAVNSSSYAVFENIYPSLVQVDPALKTVPDFAGSWQMSPDGKTWTFHTEPGAEWSDGEPLTAADAAWTFETVIKHQEGPTGSLAGYVAYMESATAPDPNTLVLKYSRPVANVLAQMSGIQILPEHIWARFAVGNGKGLLTFTNPAPVVSGGPFTLVKYAQGRIALLKRNPRYYGPAPHIDGLGLQFFDTDDAMITALKNGRLDGVQSVAPTSVAALKSAGLVVASAPERRSTTSSSTRTRIRRPTTVSWSTRWSGRHSTERSTGTRSSRRHCSASAGRGRRSSRRRPGTGATRRSSRPRTTRPRRTVSWTKPDTAWGPTRSGSRTATRCRTP